MTSSFNRTFMELKLANEDYTTPAWAGFNRTFMELKLVDNKRVEN